jgi:GTP pyrophosphokinase
MILSSKFEQALLYAATIHAGQKRVGTLVPRLAHLLAVTAIVLEGDGSEEEAIGALLHETAARAGGRDRLEDIEARFGAVVAQIVEGCTEPAGDDKTPWRARQAMHIASLPRASGSVRTVIAAAKLHQAQVILRELHASGVRAWDRVEGGKEGTLWYYRCLLKVFKTVGANPLFDELERVVHEIEQVTTAKEAEAARQAGDEAAGRARQEAAG